MKLAELKMILVTKVSESDMSVDDKNTLFKFIESANDLQTKHLLLFGTMTESVTEKKAEQINEMYKSDEIQTRLQEGVLKTLFGMFLIGPGGWAVYRAIRAAVSEKSKRCGAFAIGRERDVCLMKVKEEEARKMAALLQKEMKNCKEAKNPQKCMEVGKKKIQKYQDRAKKYQDAIKRYASKSVKKGMKAQAGIKKAQDPAGKWV